MQDDIGKNMECAVKIPSKFIGVIQYAHICVITSFGTKILGAHMRHYQLTG